MSRRRRYLKSLAPHPLPLFLRRHRVDTVLVEYASVGAQVMPLLRRLNCRTFVHFHGYDIAKYPRRSGVLETYEYMFREAAGFFSPSRYLADRAVELGCPPDKIVVCPCGVDPADFSQSAREPGRFLAVGRFVPKKAPLATLRAFAEASRNVEGLHLDYVGGGPLLDEARQFVADHGLGTKVTLHGPQRHEVVRSLFDRAQGFLQHSVTAPNGDCEGLPVAILEAMASGIPVISTRHSGIPEAVTEGETGFLVDEHDVDGMAKAIVALSGKAPAEIARMGARARALAAGKFSAKTSLRTLRDAMDLGPA